MHFCQVFWFWELFRDKVKSIKPDAYLVGELWSNAVDWVNSDYYDEIIDEDCDAYDKEGNLMMSKLGEEFDKTYRQFKATALDLHD